MVKIKKTEIRSLKKNLQEKVKACELEIAEYKFRRGSLHEALEIYARINSKPSAELIDETIKSLDLRKEPTNCQSFIAYCDHFHVKISKKDLRQCGTILMTQGQGWWKLGLEIFEKLKEKPSRKVLLGCIANIENPYYKFECAAQFGMWRQANKALYEMGRSGCWAGYIEIPQVHTTLRRIAREHLSIGKFHEAADIYFALKDSAGMKKILAALTRSSPAEFTSIYFLPEILAQARKLRVKWPPISWIQQVADHRFAHPDFETDKYCHQLYKLIKSEPNPKALRIRAGRFSHNHSHELLGCAEMLAQAGDINDVIALADRARADKDLEMAVRIYDIALDSLKKKKAK